MKIFIGVVIIGGILYIPVTVLGLMRGAYNSPHAWLLYLGLACWLSGVFFIIKGIRSLRKSKRHNGEATE